MNVNIGSHSSNLKVVENSIKSVIVLALFQSNKFFSITNFYLSYRVVREIPN